MPATTMHTSALEPPPVGDDNAHTQGQVSMQGVLLADAEVRTLVVGADAHPYPALVFEFKPLSGMKRKGIGQQIFSEADRGLAERQAATLKKGARITLTTTLDDSQLILPHVQGVVLTPPN